MEQTFMTIHNLTPDANILFASESIVDILGYTPQEVLGRSSFDYFHPDEVPFARSVHSRGVLLDKAAVLHYARIVSRDGEWISCECCFTIVHDVLVACTSIYRRGEKSERRAVEAPQIRRLFSCSPRDPRYHMLEHLSPKFKMSPMEREPRAALILNRFTRTLTIMFATESIGNILGVPANQVLHKSFYECIQESCLDDALKCLESAKANDSIAYLRFWSRDPFRPEDFEDAEDEQDQDNNTDTPLVFSGNENIWSEELQHSYAQRLPASQCSFDSGGGGVRIRGCMDMTSSQRPSPPIKVEPDLEMRDSESSSLEALLPLQPARPDILSSTIGNTTSHSSAVWPSPASPASPTYASSPPPRASRNSRRCLAPSVELEAVVSCTSDGLVVILRRARPPIPELRPPLVPFAFDNGLFAAPWGQYPIRPHYSPEVLYNFRPPYLPQHMPLRENVKAAGGPPLDQLMKSIRDVAVFAWAVVGINGNMASYSRGLPMGESQPPDGLPIWDPTAAKSSYLGPKNQAERRRSVHQSHETVPSSYDPPAYGGYAEGGSVNPDSILPDDGSFSFRKGYQWPSQTPRQTSSWPHQHHHQYIPNQHDDDQPVRQHMIQADQMNQFPLSPPTRWDDGANSSSSFQLFSSSTQDPRRYRYPW